MRKQFYYKPKEIHYCCIIYIYDLDNPESQFAHTLENPFITRKLMTPVKIDYKMIEEGRQLALEYRKQVKSLKECQHYKYDQFTLMLIEVQHEQGELNRWIQMHREDLA